MSIWFQEYTINDQESLVKGCMLEHVGIQLVAIGDDWISGTMPVDHRTKQPHGILHGGASVVLAESLGSIAANMVVNPIEYYCVGLDINANHLRPMTDGTVTGTAKAIHIGRKTRVWGIELKNEIGKLVNISRLTMAVVSRLPNNR